ncbi:hypothetical protein MUG91_G328n5 [Manis pentadactyla]|nr:hypothetical protein MUG91_G328n5 [Manis pentadactyla]
MVIPAGPKLRETFLRTEVKPITLCSTVESNDGETLSAPNWNLKYGNSSVEENLTDESDISENEKANDTLLSYFKKMDLKLKPETIETVEEFFTEEPSEVYMLISFLLLSVLWTCTNSRPRNLKIGKLQWDLQKVLLNMITRLMEMERLQHTTMQRERPRLQVPSVLQQLPRDPLPPKQYPKLDSQNFPTLSSDDLGCGVQSSLFLPLAAAKGLLLASVAYDRYVAACFPLSYPTLMNIRACVLLITGAWIMDSIKACVHTIHVLHIPYRPSRATNHFFCDVPATLTLACMDMDILQNHMILGLVGSLSPALDSKFQEAHRMLNQKLQELTNRPPMTMDTLGASKRERSEKVRMTSGSLQVVQLMQCPQT